MWIMTADGNTAVNTDRADSLRIEDRNLGGFPADAGSHVLRIWPDGLLIFQGSEDETRMLLQNILLNIPPKEG